MHLHGHLKTLYNYPVNRFFHFKNNRFFHFKNNITLFSSLVGKKRNSKFYYSSTILIVAIKKHLCGHYLPFLFFLLKCCEKGNFIDGKIL